MIIYSIWSFDYFKSKLSTDLAAGFNLGTKRTSCHGESHVIMWFMITRTALKNWPLNITLVFLVPAVFCIVFRYYLSIHQSHVTLELKTKTFRLSGSHSSLRTLNYLGAFAECQTQPQCAACYSRDSDLSELNLMLVMCSSLNLYHKTPPYLVIVT